jgi:sucrose-6-phosphate hydrolase SacC (GH32 family)
MKTSYSTLLFLLVLVALGCKNQKTKKAEDNSIEDFPSEMVKFSPIVQNPVFKGTGKTTWDKNIRERGFILYDDGYKMWYTGYNDSISKERYLGLATSKDGIHWKRFSERPIFTKLWTEDMQVVKYHDIYYMFAEGKNDVAHLLMSQDGIAWSAQGDLTILSVNGSPIAPPYGTPSVWIENDRKYLFYERNDLGIWLATSDDFKTWTNVKDEPVLEMGPGEYDSGAVAANQIVKYKGKYYMFYHGSSNPDWMEPTVEAKWTSNVAMSTDLITWTKYPENPIVEGDHSSNILVFNGEKYILFTTHDQVWRYD